MQKLGTCLVKTITTVGAVLAKQKLDGLTPLLPRVPKIQNRDKFQISFCKILKSKCCQKSNIFKILWQQLKNQSRSYSYVR